MSDANTNNKNARFFDVRAAATVMTSVVELSTIDSELEKSNIAVTKGSTEEDRAEAYLRMQGISTQGHFAAVLINLTIGEGVPFNDSNLTTALSNAFPNANISDRHGKHYMSHARHGRLKGLREDLPPIPHAVRKTRQKEEVQADLEEAKDAPELTVALLVEGNDHETLVEMAGALGIKATTRWKPETIAKKIVEAKSEAA